MIGMVEPSTPQRYRSMAEREFHDYAPSYERLALGVAGDAELIARLDTLPEPKRQPNLLFAAVRFLHGPVDDYPAFRGWLLAHWDEASSTMLARRTQTNEPARCAVLLPLLAALPQPLALLEVGASAGLCLYPDRLRYRYGGHVVGPADAPVEIACGVAGPAPLPEALPRVAWRAGLDLEPLDVTDDDHVRWLDALIWPEHPERRERLRAAVEIARADPPRLVRGDLLTDLTPLAAEAPPDATLVVMHSAVLPYVAPDDRAAFVATVRGLPAHWISNEAPGVLPEVDRRLGVEPATAMRTVLALDGEPVALAGGHGQTLEWLPG